MEEIIKLAQDFGPSIGILGFAWKFVLPMVQTHLERQEDQLEKIGALVEQMDRRMSLLEVRIRGNSRDTRDLGPYAE